MIRQSIMAAMVLIVALTVAFLPGLVQAASIAEVCKALDLKEKNVMFGSVLSSKVLEGGGKQVVAITTYLTGKNERATAVNVRLDIFRVTGKKLEPVWSRDYGEEYAGNVGRGELELIDLDMDGLNDIIVTFDRQDNPLVEQRLGEVILLDHEGFHVAWKGIMMFDATRDARTTPQERRDRFVRKVNMPRTMKTRGDTLFLDKKVTHIAGERLPTPRETVETWPLRSAMGER
jgi:hypothetical protein